MICIRGVWNSSFFVNFIFFLIMCDMSHDDNWGEGYRSIFEF